jgi:hypothetical protein
MTYKILETRQQNEILYTTVEYNFDGTIVTIDIGHSSPRDITEVEDNIKLRATTELYKIQSATKLTSIINDLQVDVEKTID